MKKEEVAEVLQVVLDGLTAGESIEKKLEETKKFYGTELAKVNKENQFYQRIIRVNLLGDYCSFKQAVLTRFETLNGLKLFQHQIQTNDYYNSHPIQGSGFDLEEFNNFVEDYVAAAREDSVIGIKEDKNQV